MSYGGYRGRCVGRLMHFLYKINHQTDIGQFDGDGKTFWLHGKVYCTYTWQDDLDVPIFTFTDPEMQTHADYIVQDLMRFETKYFPDAVWKLSECIEFHRQLDQFGRDNIRIRLSVISPSPLSQ